MPPTPRRDIHHPRKPLKSSLSKLEYNRKRYWDKREENIKKAKEYYQNNKDKILAYQKEYVDKYAEETKAYKKKWQEENKDTVVARAARWNRDNQERRLEISAIYRVKNADSIKGKNKKYRREYRRLAVEHYSNGDNKCACCEENLWEFLTIDHINGEGNKHRKEIHSKGGYNFYYWLKRNGFPPGYRVLCMNCNHSNGIWGYCPHQIPQNTIAPL